MSRTVVAVTVLAFFVIGSLLAFAVSQLVRTATPLGEPKTDSSFAADVLGMVVA
jgi:hypothetical protein